VDSGVVTGAGADAAAAEPNGAFFFRILGSKETPVATLANGNTVRISSTSKLEPGFP
jgi:hypothetical protein